MGTRNKPRTLAHIEHIEVEDEGNLLTRLLDAFHLTTPDTMAAEQGQGDPVLILQAELNILRQQLQTQNDILQQHQVQIATPAPPRIKPD